MKTKVLKFLGIAMGAGKLVTGESMTIADIKNKKVKMVFLATDASERTHKTVQDKCSYYNVPLVNLYTQEELSQAIGKTRMVIGICDDGFSTRMKELLSS